MDSPRCIASATSTPMHSYHRREPTFPPTSIHLAQCAAARTSSSRKRATSTCPALAAASTGDSPSTSHKSAAAAPACRTRHSTTAMCPPAAACARALRPYASVMAGDTPARRSLRTAASRPLAHAPRSASPLAWPVLNTRTRAFPPWGDPPEALQAAAAVEGLTTGLCRRSNSDGTTPLGLGGPDSSTPTLPASSERCPLTDGEALPGFKLLTSMERRRIRSNPSTSSSTVAPGSAPPSIRDAARREDFLRISPELHETGTPS